MPPRRLKKVQTAKTAAAKKTGKEASKNVSGDSSSDLKPETINMTGNGSTMELTVEENTAVDDKWQLKEEASQKTMDQDEVVKTSEERIVEANPDRTDSKVNIDSTKAADLKPTAVLKNKIEHAVETTDETTGEDEDELDEADDDVGAIADTGGDAHGDVKGEHGVTIADTGGDAHGDVEGEHGVTVADKGGDAHGDVEGEHGVTIADKGGDAHGDVEGEHGVTVADKGGDAHGDVEGEHSVTIADSGVVVQEMTTVSDESDADVNDGKADEDIVDDNDDGMEDVGDDDNVESDASDVELDDAGDDELVDDQYDEDDIEGKGSYEDGEMPHQEGDTVDAEMDLDEDAKEINTSEVNEREIDTSKEMDTSKDTQMEMKTVQVQEETGGCEMVKKSRFPHLEPEPYPESFHKLSRMTVNIGPIRQQDLKSDDLHEILGFSSDFDIKFQSKEVENSTDDTVKQHVKDKLGFVRIPFHMRTPQFLLKVTSELGKLSIGGRDMSVKFPQTFHAALEDLQAYTERLKQQRTEKGKLMRELWPRQLTLTQIPASLQEESVQAMFPEATFVEKKITVKGTPLVVMDFETEEEAARCFRMNKDIVMGNHEVKLFYGYQEWANRKQDKQAKQTNQAKPTAGVSGKGPQSPKGKGPDTQTDKGPHSQKGKGPQSQKGQGPQTQKGNGPQMQKGNVPGFGVGKKAGKRGAKFGAGNVQFKGSRGRGGQFRGGVRGRGAGRGGAQFPAGGGGSPASHGRGSVRGRGAGWGGAQFLAGGGMNISRRGYVQLGMNMPNQQQQQEQQNQQQELLQLQRLVAQQATNLAMAGMAGLPFPARPMAAGPIPGGQDAGQSRKQAKRSRTRNDSHSEDRHRDKPHTQQMDNTNREGQRQRRRQSRWDSRPSESPKWARDMSPERGRQSDGRQRESPPRSRDMRDRAKGDTRDKRRDDREPSGDRVNKDNPKAMMEHLKAELAKMEEKIMKRGSASGGGREGDSQQAGKRKGDYSDYKQDDRKKRYREPQQGGSHGYRGHREDNIGGQDSSFVGQDSNFVGQDSNFGGQGNSFGGQGSQFGNQDDLFRGQVGQLGNLGGVNYGSQGIGNSRGQMTGNFNQGVTSLGLGGGNLGLGGQGVGNLGGQRLSNFGFRN